MSNLEKFNEIFIKIFNIDNSDSLKELSKETVDYWDSVYQLTLTNLIEDTFDIMLEPEDIMDFTSYKKGIEILKKYDIDL